MRAIQELDWISRKSWVRNTIVGVVWDDISGQVISGGIHACVGGWVGQGGIDSHSRWIG